MVLNVSFEKKLNAHFDELQTNTTYHIITAAAQPKLMGPGKQYSPCNLYLRP